MNVSYLVFNLLFTIAFTAACIAVGWLLRGVFDKRKLSKKVEKEQE